MGKKLQEVNNKIKVYALINPINDHVFYIGLTANKLNERLGHHISDRSSRKYEVIAAIKEMSLKPEILLLDEVEFEKASFFEEHYISLFRSFGYDLKQGLNSTYNATYKKHPGSELVNVYFGDEIDLYNKVVAQAKTENRSIGNMITVVVKQYLERKQ